MKSHENYDLQRCKNGKKTHCQAEKVSLRADPNDSLEGDYESMCVFAIESLDNFITEA